MPASDTKNGLEIVPEDGVFTLRRAMKPREVLGEYGSRSAASRARNTIIKNAKAMSDAMKITAPSTVVAAILNDLCVAVKHRAGVTLVTDDLESVEQELRLLLHKRGAL